MKDCGYPNYDADSRMLHGGTPVGACPSGCGGFDPFEFDCDIVQAAEGLLVTYPAGGVFED
jgi:hypothetical protein